MAIKTKYKYIHFEQGNWGAWLCKNSETTTHIAYVIYSKEWRQYVAAFDKHAAFSADCLVDIADFLNQLNKEKQIDPK